MQPMKRLWPQMTVSNALHIYKGHMVLTVNCYVRVHCSLCEVIKEHVFVELLEFIKQWVNINVRPALRCLLYQ